MKIFMTVPLLITALAGFAYANQAPFAEPNPLTSLGPLKKGRAEVRYYNANISPHTYGANTYVVAVEGVGDVVFEVFITPNLPCTPACADTATVISVPDGFYVSPQVMELQEETFGTFAIREFIGG